jgi:Uma2 family endonuclease
VAELRSPSDSLRALQVKMREYADTGTRLGWLIDPLDRTVYTYRPGEAVEVVTDAETASGEPVLPSFVLDLRRLWRDDF